MGKLLDRIDQWQRRHRASAVGFAVVRKFGQDQASNLAALIAYYAFFSIFPLMLALTTILGYITAGNAKLKNQIFHDALGSFPIIGHEGPKPITGSAIALIVGLALALYSGLAVAKTAQTAFNDVYAVPKAERPNFIKGIVRAVMLILIVGSGLIAATVVGSFASSAGELGLNFLGPGLRILSVLLSIAVLAAVFDGAFNWLTVREMTWKQALPGAILAAVGYEILSQLATAFITHKANGASSTYGTFATVIALLSWFYLTAQVVLLAAELNVVLHYRLWPRALRGEPDTEADYRALEFYAEKERYHHEEDVDTSFEGRDSESYATEQATKAGPKP